MPIKRAIDRWRRERLIVKRLPQDPDEAVRQLLVELVRDIEGEGFSILQLIDELDTSPLEWVEREYRLRLMN